eukprot:1271432-Prymnesium_polylepis.1
MTQVERAQLDRACRHRSADHDGRPTDVALIAHVLVERKEILRAGRRVVPKRKGVPVTPVEEDRRHAHVWSRMVREVTTHGVEAKAPEDACALRPRLHRGSVTDAGVRRVTAGRLRGRARQPAHRTAPTDPKLLVARRERRPDAHRRTASQQSLHVGVRHVL